MLLLTGPPGSGKTFHVLERLRDALRRRDSGVRLLTPTATLAQHLQNEVAREGFVFRPALIQTLSRFVDPLVPEALQVSAPLFYLIAEEAALRANRPEFARVVRQPGFCAGLARTMDEFSSAGCGAERLAATLPRHGAGPLSEPFVAVYREVEKELHRRSLATRSERLMIAAQRIAEVGLPGVHTIWLDGFHALPDPELAVIAALYRHADVTITLPAAPITEPARRRLLAAGFTEQVCGFAPAQPLIELCEAPTIEREAGEIARRILEQAAAGRPIRDMAVAVRSPELYEPILRATLDRFGIPARFYFDADLSRHTLVRCLAGIVDALLGGWDHAATLAALRLAGVACDEFDFAVRESLPGAGLASLQLIAARTSHPVSQLLRVFQRLDEWPALSLTPPEWAARLQRLGELAGLGQPGPGTYETATIGRGQAAALNLFADAMEEAARSLDPHPVSLRDFWRAAKSVLRLTPLRVEDGRRNLVHVLGVHEARQWRLPAVFVCGLVETQFPKHQAPDLFFSEAAREQLKQAGIRLRRATDFEAEERFLFDAAITRATESLTLSYPRFDARGQRNLPSRYLDGLGLEASPVPPCPTPRVSTRAEPPAAVITSPAPLKKLAERHQVFRTTALESYLQCPFQFFGRYTLELQGAPPRPERRLDFRTQGTIAHAVLATVLTASQPLEDVFDCIFARICEEQRVPAGYRMAACRERMLSDLRALLEDPQWTNGCETLTEQKFRYQLADGIEISGRIDRIDLSPEGAASVIDYKYSGAQNTRNLAKSENVLQPQLYLLAAEHVLHLRPVSMLYWGLKGGIERQGWSAPFPPDWLPQAIETTARIAAEIRAGCVEPRPADPDKCRVCDLRDVCRFAAEGAPE